MPTRTIVQDLCDVCFAENEDGESTASNRIRFSWRGQSFVLLVCDEHVEPIRDELQHLSELAAPEGRAPRSTVATRQPRQPRQTVSPAQPGRTLFSQLSDDEKLRFREWADMPKARRIGDARVKEWTEAGMP